MKRFVPTADAYRLFHECQLALSEVESAGVRIDTDYLDRATAEASEGIREAEAAVLADPVYRRHWHRRYGDRANIRSPEQLAAVVFGDLGYPSKGKTAKGKRDAADQSAFDGIDLPVVKNYFKAAKLRKGRDTYLAGIRREMVRHADGDWYVHPSYNLNTVQSFRSSCDSPNFQNNPVRSPEIAELTRRCYVPRRGHQLLELDYGQIEVKISECYHLDPVMLKYITDPTTDMHRDMAAQIFMLRPDQVEKPARDVAKNQFVFPEFYGSYYAQCAPDIWQSIDRRGLTVKGETMAAADGKLVPLTVREHLRRNGIAELGACDPDQRPVRGTFEYHLKEIEEDFWGRRFAVYARWKRDWVAAYHRDGGCQFLSGFVMTGPHAKNDITNYAIQGTSFHCLAWSLPVIVRRLRRYKMRTRVIGEVHDCINFDAHPRERDDVIDLSVRVMTEEIKRWAPWLNVQLTVEPEACPIDGSWFEKAALAPKGGVWVPAKPDDWENKYGPWDKQIVA